MTDNFAETSEEAWQRLGFTEKNISSIGGKGKSNKPKLIADIKDAIDTHETTLASLMKQTGLKPSNISSMLGKSYAHGAEAIEALCEDGVIAKLVALSTGRKIDDAADAEPSFTPYHPSAISGILSNSRAEIGQAVAALYEARPALQHFMDETAMELKNVSSIFASTGTAIKEAAEKLTTADEEGKTPTDKLHELLEMKVIVRGEAKPLFTINNLSSMLHKSGANAADGIDALYNAQETFKELIESGRWQMQNLSSMLHGARQHIGKAIIDLSENIPKLQDIIHDTDFTAKNLSSMLNGAGQNIGKAITEGLKEIKELDQKIKNQPNTLSEDKRYTHTNISSAINGSGAKVGDSIAMMLEKWDKLVDVMKEGNYKASHVATKLSQTSFSERAALIDELHANIGEATEIPAGAATAIASESQAAAQQKAQEK